MNYYTDELTNEEYRDPNKGFSTSNVKDYLTDPALVIWGKDAPQNKEALKVIDFGTDFHAYFLEPEEFKKNYQVLPEFNRRKKEEKQAELDLMADWKEKGITPIKAEDMLKLEAMRLSAMAHPTVNAIMSMKGGIAERSFFWIDEDSGVKCKCRPDWLVTDISEKDRLPFMPEGCSTLIMDVKTIANIDLIQNQSEKLKYHVQDAFYSHGVEVVTNSKVCFVFVYVSTSMALGRHPVRCVQLSDTARFDGEQDYQEALNGYAKRQKSGDKAWLTTIEIDRPSWATKEEDIF